MRNVIYLKNLGDSVRVLEDGRTTEFTSKFQICFNKSFSGFESQYGQRVIKYLRAFLIDTANYEGSGIFKITKLAKCSEEDEFDAKLGEKLARTKVEIQSTKIASKLLRFLKDEILEKEIELLENQAKEVDIRTASEVGYYIEASHSLN